MPSRKEWEFKVKWFDKNNKQQEMGGYVTAAGAGSVQDPLDKYDIVIVF